MADLGISHAHADQYRSVRIRKSATTKSKALLVVHGSIMTAAFAFVAAMVFGFFG